MAKRKCLTIGDKLKVLEAVDGGTKQKNIAAKFGIAANTVSGIVKNREKLLKESEQWNSGRKRMRLCMHEDLDKAVLKWIHVVRDKNIPLSGSMVKEKALFYAQSLGHSNFQASNGWLQKFKIRNSICEKVICGESADVSDEKCLEWTQSVLKNILEKYDPKDIFNADETGLFFKCIPNRTLTFKNDKCFGGKNSKERITVMIGANMIGTEKLKLLVIGKSKNPRCFKGVKSLEVDYDFNKKAWMTSSIFEEWLSKFNKKIGREGRKVALIVDNCPAHPSSIKSKFKNVELVFFPPNMTSKLQPMDQGIIKNLKFHYRKKILHKIITAIELNQPTEKIIDLRECISELAKAWRYEVTETTIKNCFGKAGFTCDLSSWEDEDNVQLSELRKMWGQLKVSGNVSDQIELDEFLNVDEDVLVTEYPDDKDILETVREENETNETEIDEDEDETVIQNPSEIAMVNAFETLRCGFQCQENVPDTIFNALNKCEAFYENKMFFKCTQQSKITSFFNNIK